MSWEQPVLALCSVSVALIGWVTYKRGSNTDTKLNIAANMQATYESQAGFIDDLREDVVRLRAAHQACEDATNDLRRSLADSHLREDEQHREVARLKAIVNEHEVTIARHETTINNMVKAARGDR